MPTHYRACNLCEAICGLTIEHENGKILSIRGDEKDPSAGAHLPKAVALRGYLRRPRPAEVPGAAHAPWMGAHRWEEAYDEVATNLRKGSGKAQYGRRRPYFGNPNVHNLGGMLFSGSFPKHWGRKPLQRHFRRPTAASCGGAHHVWTGLLLPVPDVSRTHFMLIIGVNPLVSNGSMMTAPGFARHMKGIQETGWDGGGDRPAAHGDGPKGRRPLFHPSRAMRLLLLAMIHTLIKEGLVKLGIGNLTGYLEQVQKSLPMASARICRSPLAWKRKISAGSLAISPSPLRPYVTGAWALYAGLRRLVPMADQRAQHPHRQPRPRRGAMFTNPPSTRSDSPAAKAKPASLVAPQPRVSSLPEYSGEFPVAALAEEILTPGDGQIMSHGDGGKPGAFHPNGRQLDKAMSRPGIHGTIDIYINETTRHANIILPPPPGWKRNITTSSSTSW